MWQRISWYNAVSSNLERSQHTNMYISNFFILSLSAAALCVMARYHLIQSIFFIACMCVFFLVKKHKINIEFVPFLLTLLSILWRAFIAFSLIEISSNTSNEHIYRRIRLQTSYPFSMHWLFVYKRIFYHGIQSMTLRHNIYHKHCETFELKVQSTKCIFPCKK